MPGPKAWGGVASLRHCDLVGVSDRGTAGVTGMAVLRDEGAQQIAAGAPSQPQPEAFQLGIPGKILALALRQGQAEMVLASNLIFINSPPGSTQTCREAAGKQLLLPPAVMVSRKCPENA